MNWWATQIFYVYLLLLMRNQVDNHANKHYLLTLGLWQMSSFFLKKVYSNISSWPKYSCCSQTSFHWQIGDVLLLHLYSNHFYVDPVNLNTKWRKQVQQILSTTTIQTFKENHRTFLHFNWGNTVPVFGVDMQRPSVSTEDVFVLNEITETEYRPTKPDHPHLNN